MGAKAGPLGRGIARVVGWFSGLGRFIVPVALVGAGVALIRRGRSDHRWRLAIGWGVTALAVLGLLHLARGPQGLWSGFDELGRAGGWLGAAVGVPLEALLSSWGAAIRASGSWGRTCSICWTRWLRKAARASPSGGGRSAPPSKLRGGLQHLIGRGM